MNFALQVLYVMLFMFFSPAAIYYSVVGVGAFFKMLVTRHWAKHRKKLRVLLRDNAMYRGTKYVAGMQIEAQDITYQDIVTGKGWQNVVHSTTPAHKRILDATLEYEKKRSDEAADKYAMKERWYTISRPPFDWKYGGWAWFRPLYRTREKRGWGYNFFYWVAEGRQLITQKDGWMWKHNDHWSNKEPVTVSQIWQHFFFKLFCTVAHIAYLFWNAAYEMTRYLQIWIEQVDYAEDLYARIANKRGSQMHRALDARKWMTKKSDRRVHDGDLNKYIDLPYDETWMEVKEVEHRNTDYGDENTWEYNFAFWKLREEIAHQFGEEREGGFWATGNHDTYYRIFTGPDRFHVSPVFEFFYGIENKEDDWFITSFEMDNHYIFEEQQETIYLQWSDDYIDEDKMLDFPLLEEKRSFAAMYHSGLEAIWRDELVDESQLPTWGDPLMFHKDFDDDIPVWAYFLSIQLRDIEEYPNEHVQHWSDWQVIQGLYMMDLLDEDKVEKEFHKQRREEAVAREKDTKRDERPSWYSGWETYKNRRIPDGWYQELQNLKRMVAESKTDSYSRLSAFWDSLLGFSPFLSETERRSRDARQFMKQLPGFEEFFANVKNQNLR